MDNKRYCVYNKTTASFLSVGASVVDAELEPVKAQQMMVDVENLTPESSFWLKPFKAILVARIVCPFDMVFLTEELRVVHALELSPAVELPPIEDQAASALVLPFHTAYLSRTYPGDQLIICAAEELVRHLAHVPGSASSAPDLRSPKSYPEEPRSPRPVLVSGPPEKQQTAAEPQGIQAAAMEEKIDAAHGAEEKRRLEFQAEEIDAVISQVRSWAGELPRPKAPVSIAPAQASLRKNREFVAKEADRGGGLPPRFAEELPRRKPATQRVEEREKVETQARVSRESVDLHTQDVESVVSQVLRWAEETGRPIARAPIAAIPPAPSVSRAASTPGRPRAESDPARTHSDGGSGRRETAVKPVEEKGKPEEGLKGSWISRFFHWAGELAHLLLGMSTKATGERSSTSSPAGKAGGHRSSLRSSLGVHVKRLEVATEQLNAKANARTVAQHMHSLRTRFVRWLDADSLATVVSAAPGDRRRSKRHPLPGLVAYYWTGGTPQAHQIGDISSTGFYLLTKERWVPDTLIRMTLQRPGPKGGKAEEAICVVSRVVRWGDDGVGYEFVASKALEMSGERVDRPNEARQRLY